MNNNGSRNWLMWLLVILAVVAVVYFVKNRMQKEEMVPQEVTVVTEEEMSPETQVDAVPVAEQPEPTEQPAQ